MPKFSKVLISVSRYVLIYAHVHICVVRLKSLNRYLVRLITVDLSVVSGY